MAIAARASNDRRMSVGSVRTKTRTEGGCPFPVVRRKHLKAGYAVARFLSFSQGMLRGT